MDINDVALVIALVAVAAGALAVRRWLREKRFIWRTDDITASILLYDERVKTGRYLNLDQTLRPGEGGWTNMRISIPERWIVRDIAAIQGRVTLTLFDGSTFQLHRRNVGPLRFDILDGGDDKSDHELEVLWRKHASTRARVDDDHGRPGCSNR